MKNIQGDHKVPLHLKTYLDISYVPGTREMGLVGKERRRIEVLFIPIFHLMRHFKVRGV
jgi:hypothetical protein